MYEIDTESIIYAFNHLSTVAKLHMDQDESSAEVGEAISLVPQGLGMTEDAVSLMMEQVKKVSPELREASWMVLGVIVGLAAAQHGAESE